MNRLTGIMQNLLLVGQLGISFVTPPLVLVWLAYRAQTRLGWGTWVTITAILVGILTGFASVWRTLCPLTGKKPEPPQGRSFNDHI